ncbi:AT-rich interactive domain-containing protein 5B isoform X2 [Corythoichthys intestinalis]|uniref:AT-rich interactive domain-containing protein 5B isoform X2 n=1 Tax=Corythoichthys intestinalis TaxID=161448 RepID=UPI0025A6436D|nr:AT-rich interactive domain-containing protein 5B isoform X2 [Corythoichthys intestinalis]
MSWVGSSCGLHGPYVFYKAFKFASRDAEARILSLGDFFLVRCKPDEPVCVAELQLLWEERTSRQLLSSSKLYFLPEDTPHGRDVSHGEHEVIAVSEKVIVRLQDLVKWTVPNFSEWTHGLKAEPLKASVLRELGTNGRREALHRYRESTLTSGLNFKDVQRERARLGQEEDGRKVLVLSYPQYCRYRSVLVRLREQPTSLLLNHTVLALGGIAALGGNTRILYCRDTFEHPTLLQNESICDQFAPNLKGRPRKKKLSISQRRDSHGCITVTALDPNSLETKTHKVKASCKALANGKLSSGKLSSSTKHKASVGLSRKLVAPEEMQRLKEMVEERSEQEENRHPSSLASLQLEEEEATIAAIVASSSLSEESREDEQAFLVELYKYMKKRDTPIERIPFLGFKQINLWTMFQAAQKLGGYELITVRRQWKHVYDELGGNPSSTSAATCTRRHYERLLLPYERHLKGEQDKPLPLTKPRNHEKATSAKAKGAGVKKAKGSSGAKQARKERVEAAKAQQESQDSKVKGEVTTKLELPAVDEPIIIEEEEEELHVTLKKEESLAGEMPTPMCFKEADSSRAPLATRPLHAGAQPEWRKISEVLQTAKTEVHLVTKSTYLPHLWDQNKPPGHFALPESSSRDKDSSDSHGGRVGKVLSMCKQDRQSIDLSTDSFPEKEDYGVIQKDSPAQMAAYCKTGQGVMSPLAKKKLLSQVCESTSFSFVSSLQPPIAPERETEKRKSEEDGQRQHASDNVPEAAPIFRPSVIHHAQSSKPQQERSVSHILPPHVSAPWQPYLTRTKDRDAVENTSEKLLQSRSFAGDCYSSPHLHSLYRQTENCLSQDRIAGYSNGERQERFVRDREGEQGFVCCGLEKEGLAYRSHYSDEAQTRGESREAEDQPRDFTISKPLSQRVSTVSKPSFCGLPYSIVHQGLDSHPKGCRVPAMTVSPPKQDPSPTFPNPKSLSESSLASPVRPSKRSVGEAEIEEAPERKVRVVTPIHPASAVRRSDPEELKPAEPAHAVHLNNHPPEGHPATTYTLSHAAPLYAGMYPPGSLVSQNRLQQHPGLQYLKSQSAVSPLVPPLAFHSMMLHRQLLASAPSPHHFFRHPGGAALYGDLLHQLYPLSTLPQPQLSSVHPSTRL